MEIIFSIVLILALLIFYFSNPKNKINKTCSLYIAIVSFGVHNEVLKKYLLPFFQSVSHGAVSEEISHGIYSFIAWVSYSLSVPAFLILGLYIYGFDKIKPRLFSILKIALWTPAAVLPFVYHPVNFTAYPMNGNRLWMVYSLYNLGYSAVSIGFTLKGIHNEKSQTVRKHKIKLGLMIIPPTIYVLLAVFVIRPLGMEKLFDMWKWNVVFVSLNLVVVLVMAFKDGFLGLKLSAQNYEWDTDMDLFGKGVDYTNHMLKNQTSKMEMCIEQLKNQYPLKETPEELAILSRSISNLKNYVNRMKLHSQNIFIYEESCSLSGMLADATPVTMDNISLNIRIPDNMLWICDKRHITEVFSNILINAVEAIREGGSIEITGEKEKSNYLLQITDTGMGMDEYELQNMFNPLFTTKSTEKNFGLGLTYCMTVIKKHEGNISAQSKRERGTTITIAFPLKRVVMDGGTVSR